MTPRADTPLVETVTQPRQDRFRVITARVVFALLLAFALTASALRVVATDDLFARAEVVRRQRLGLTIASDPIRARREARVREADAKFAAHRVLTRVHVITGAAFLLLASLQLMRRVRTRAPRVHRWSGRVALVLAWLTGLTGLFFGLWHPVAGVAEQLIIGVVGLFLLTSVTIAYRHVRAFRVAAHREWMLRGIAAALAVATVRLVGLPIDLALTPRGVDLRVSLVLSMWIGWSLTMAGAEWWIRTTRSTQPTSANP